LNLTKHFILEPDEELISAMEATGEVIPLYFQGKYEWKIQDPDIIDGVPTPGKVIYETVIAEETTEIETVKIFLPPPGEEDSSFIIDIQYGIEPNLINLDSKGVTPVVIFSTPDFDATTEVDATTCELAGTGVSQKGKNFQAADADVDGDGLIDKVLKFVTKELNLTASGGEEVLLRLECELTGGDETFVGADTAIIVPPKK
jgi:hypothetical protein